MLNSPTTTRKQLIFPSVQDFDQIAKNSLGLKFEETFLHNSLETFIREKNKKSNCWICRTRVLFTQNKCFSEDTKQLRNNFFEKTLKFSRPPYCTLASAWSVPRWEVSWETSLFRGLPLVFAAQKKPHSNGFEEIFFWTFVWSHTRVHIGQRLPLIAVASHSIRWIFAMLVVWFNQWEVFFCSPAFWQSNL